MVNTSQNEGHIFLGTSRSPDDALQGPEWLNLKLANRHGLITGATGTGKTVSLQILTEGFSNAGVPVFCADVKGDLSGLAMKGESKTFLEKRADGHRPGGLFLRRLPDDLLGPVRRKGPSDPHDDLRDGPAVCSSRLMDLTDAQEGVLNIAFRIADEEGLLLLDLKDLQSLLIEVSNRSKELSARHSATSRPRSVAAIQRSLLVLEQQGGDALLRRAGVGDCRPHAHDPRRARHGQHSGRRQADDVAAPLRDVPAVAAVGTVRGTAGGRRPGPPAPRLLLRRSAPAVRRCAEDTWSTVWSRS